MGLTLAGAFAPACFAAQPLVDVDWVKAHSCDEGVVVLDVRNRLDGGSKTAYLQGHIPCAVHSDYLKDGWRSTVNNVPGQFSPVPKLEKLVGSLGIDNETHVVIYHAGKTAVDTGSATRVYWTFKVLGHDNVSILNGGLAEYLKGKNKLERGANKPEPKTFKASLRADMIATKDDVVQAIDAGTPVVDHRPNHQYIGINRHPKAKRNGTIANAVSLPESWLTQNGGGSFRQSEELKDLYAVAEVPVSGKQISFCNTGHWASLGWFVSSQIMGNEGVTLYDGSMVEWSADTSKPMEQKVKLN
jgi:thiosulfate/3-mercaptopyruvate sulfurtransferase